MDFLYERGYQSFIKVMNAWYVHYDTAVEARLMRCVAVAHSCVCNLTGQKLNNNHRFYQQLVKLDSGGQANVYRTRKGGEDYAIKVVRIENPNNKLDDDLKRG